MQRTLLLLLVYFAVRGGSAAAQPFHPEPNLVFDDAVLPSIFITIDPSSLDAIMADVHSDVEYPALFVFDNGSIRDTVENVGFRLRGNTSRTSPKKSFKVSFNTFEQGRKFYGLEKLNINGEHNDPSIIRSKLGWDLFATLAVPATRANHVKLYVNGAYYGLYINVEHIDEQFLQSRFGNDEGNLYKCLYPADLTFRGPDAGDYRPSSTDRTPYDLTQGASDEEGYGDLAHFIDVVNNTPDGSFREAIEAIFDVNGYLRAMAADVVLGNWDNYWFLKNNFYLYNNPATGRFHFIPYDIDNSFGVDFVDADWGRRDPYSWGHPTEPRPMAERILAVPEFRDRYTFYIKQLIEGPARPVPLSTRANQIRGGIREAAEADPFHRIQWGWSGDSFERSYTGALGGHVEYGLYDFMTTRANSVLGQIESVDIAPILSGLRHTPERPGANDAIEFRVLVEDEEAPAAVELEVWSSDGTVATTPMLDDGRSGDLAAADGFFGAALSAFHRNDSVTYRVVATDASGQSSRSDEFVIEIGHRGPDLAINEMMTSNGSTLADPFGEFDDWIEIYNASDAAVSLEGYSLADDIDEPSEWTFPDVEIAAGGFLIVWMDGQPEQGPLHVPFRLDREGEEVGLFDATGAPVSTFAFGEQERDVAYGRDPDGGDVLGPLSRATPGASNNGTAVGSEQPDRIVPGLAVRAYPNPVLTALFVEVDLPDGGLVTIEIFDAIGRQVRRLAAGEYPPGPVTLAWNGRDEFGRMLGNGVYLLRVVSAGGRAVTRPIVLAR